MHATLNVKVLVWFLHVLCNFGTGLSRIPFSEQVSKRQYPCKWNLSVTSYGSVSKYPEN